MSARAVFTADFQRDLRTQTRRLLAEEKTAWAERLFGEIELVALLLAKFPEAGLVELSRQGREVRRVMLRRLPLVAWYVWQERKRKVIVLRLFHLRQHR